ncbi:diguanylate cyclase (GGDEF) domain-containing protein [Pseudoxanthomonas wuyuanensis]|uniref:diguanylate cyclase n=1 Tax=Pseudoxanthomonas wuyuanensis TaxID=1073196 RepID=A0A286DAI2_9GAMM|nr:GGDEF domain-containing protein [Pseudoxanthomonas wuyuanensis]SOD55642.1 diguanylate cyclase (GGDEF) domain-containing protein [Pseudoxanthomonas wuyuanensis]
MLRNCVRSLCNGLSSAAVALSLWLPLPALAAGAPVPAVRSELSAPMRLEAYGPDNGLSQSTISALQSDDQGFLWVGTQEGLNRFDGHRFRIHRRDPADPRSLASSSFDALAFEAGRQRLWLGTNDAGVEVVHLPDWRRRHLGTAQGLSHHSANRILLDPAGGAWVGTGAGVDHIDAELQQVRRLGRSADVVGLALTGGGNNALALDRQCRLWRVGRQAMAPLLDAPVASGACVDLQLGPEGVWVASDNQGLYLLDPTSGRRLRHYPPQRLRGPAVHISALARLADGRVLIGFNDGNVMVIATAGADPRPLPLDRTLPSPVLAFHQDPSGTLWIGTYTSGLYRVRPLSAAIRHDRADTGDLAGWPSRSLRALWRQGDHLLVGTDAGLMQRRGNGAWQSVGAFAGQSVRVIRPAASGDGWWVGTHGGLWRWHGGDRATPLPGLPDSRIDDLLVEGDTLWVATRNGLARVEAGAVVDDARLAPLAGRLITSLLRDADGSLWIATNANGLWRLASHGAATRFEPGGAGLHDSLWSLHAQAGALWAGSFSGGLYRIDRATGQSRAFTSHLGLNNNVIYRILADADGRLWLSTNSGLSVLDPATSIIQNLSRRDGLNNQEFNSGSAFRDAQGLLYFGGTEGLDTLDPRGLSARSQPARPLLTGLVRIRDGNDLAVNSDIDIVYAQRLQLDHRDSVFSIAMTALDFTAPDAARLRYRVEGLHHDWVYLPAAHGEFSVSRLPAGDYTLQVEAAGRDGQFGQPRRLDIRMAPPPWRHPLAWAGYALLGLLLAGWWLRRIGATVRRERQRIDLLNRTVAERTAQLEQANRLLRQSNAQLDVATRRDPLTRVSNRRDLKHWLDHEAAQLQLRREQGNRADQQLMFFMIDIDDFKRVNDSHGHPAGDQVLVTFADRLRLLCREHDLLVRWGGEEFLLISRFAQAQDAAQLAERIRDAMAGQPIEIRPGVPLYLTCSIGFAPWPFTSAWPSVGDWEQSVELADRCLYAAKGAGKHAWVGLVPGDAADRRTVERLLAGIAPDQFGRAYVRVLHSTERPPRFER